MGGQAQVLISRQTRELTSEIEPVYHTSPACEVQGNNIFAESISHSFDQTSSLDYVTMLIIILIITSKQTESQHIFGKQDHLR